jgi:glutathionylspermidine synthase
VETQFIGLVDIGLRSGGADEQFVDLDDQPIRTLFKLVPWEWLLADPFGQALAEGWGDDVKKPVLGREGANVSLVEAGQPGASSPGPYAEDLFVYQRRARLLEADGNFAVLGSWVVNRQACGLGVRESTSPITNNLARFVPHVMAG